MADGGLAERERNKDGLIRSDWSFHSSRMGHVGENVAGDGTLEFVVWGTGVVSGLPVPSMGD